MNCAEVMELKQRSLDGELTQSEESLLTEHIRRCPACAEMAERLETIHQELVHLPKVTPPYSLVDAILPSLQQLDKEQAAAAGASPSPASGSMERQGSATGPGKREQKLQAVTPVQKWYRKRPWRSAGAVVAAGLVFGLFMVMFKPPTATEQAGDFTELMSKSSQESGAVPNSSQALRSTHPDGKPATPEPKAGAANDGNAPNTQQQQDAQLPDGTGQKWEEVPDTAPAKPAEGSGAAEDRPKKNPKREQERKPAASPPAEKQEKNGKQDKKAEEPAAGKQHTGADPAEQQDSQVPPSIPAVTENEELENGSSADAGSMGFADSDLNRQSLFAASKEATSPDGKWMVLWENGQLMLYGVTDTEQTKLQTLAFADRPEELIWSSDSSRLEVTVRTADGVRQFHYDVSSNGLTETAAGEAEKKEPVVVPGTAKPAT
ncbi:MAG: transcriptional regulator [Paenibacillus dendritiformis]|uniref:anti-sigma factor family protein n=1 Tax=uncultured Paenibacillus sp. TaxID=227322 RepID=UPI0025DA60CE|nr:transcriptional regulator [uncultured Paenibacillus sp.]MDU5141414.1 transcriptional regulator [Paenibacillus dendritiformis]